MKILVIGDSITKGTYTAMENCGPTSIVKVAFADIVKDRLNYDEVLNLGVNGISYSSLSPICSESSLTNRIDEFIGADMVIVCAGTNDFGTNVPLGSESDSQDVSFFGAVDMVLNGIKKNNPTAKLYVLTPLPRYDERENKIGLSIDDYRNAITIKAKNYGYKVIDGSKVPINPNCISDRKTYMLDGVHINGRGHRLVAEHIISAIREESLTRIKSDDVYALLENAKNGETVLFPENKTIDFWADDCKRVYGYHFSNTASYQENPDGERPTALYLKDKNNIVIDGNGCKIILHGVFTPFLFDNCKNIVLKNISFDYARPTMSEFLIHKEGDSYTLKIHPDSLFKVEKDRLFWKGELRLNGEPFWRYDYRELQCISMYKDLETEQTRMLDSDAEHLIPCVPEFSEVEKISDCEVKVSLKNKNAFFPDKCVVQTRLTARDQIGGCFFECRNVKMTNVAVHAMHGFGILAQNCENVIYNQVKIMPVKNRTIASNADFFQFSGCSGKIIVKHCTLKEGHDDFINIHGTHLKIVEVGTGYFVVRFMNPNSRGFKAFDKGDYVDLIDKDTLKPYGTVQVIGYKKLNDTDILLQLRGEHNAKIGDCVENVTKTPQVKIVDNEFGPSMGRGILCTTRKNVLIRKNVFYKTGGNVLTIADDCNFWFESGYVNHVKFVKNVIVACGYGYHRGENVPVVSVEPMVMSEVEDCYVHNRIEIKNNRFYETPNGSKKLSVRYTKCFEFVKNQTDGVFAVDAYKVQTLKNHNTVKL